MVAAKDGATAPEAIMVSLEQGSKGSSGGWQDESGGIIILGETSSMCSTTAAAALHLD